MLLRSPRSCSILTHPALVALVLVMVLLWMGGTGFGASAGSVSPEARVLSTISITSPSALSAQPALCTRALAPLDTDGCQGVGFTPGAPGSLALGSLSGSDVQAGALQWRVSTTSPSGYRVRMLNAGAAPVLRAGSGESIADMTTSGAGVAAQNVPADTHFGVALGTSAGEAAVSFTGSPWAPQGALFRGIPTGGMIVAERSSPQANDPFTATFAVAATASKQPAAGSYAGTVRIIASTI